MFRIATRIVLAGACLCAPAWAEDGPAVYTTTTAPKDVAEHRVRVRATPVLRQPKVEPSTLVLASSIKAAPARTFLGVHVSNAPAALTKQLELPDGFGLVVDHVTPDSPAAKAGLEQNELLYMFEDQYLVNAPQLATLVRSKNAGDQIELTVIRKAKQHKLTVTLTEPPKGLPTRRPIHLDLVPPQRFNTTPRLQHDAEQLHQHIRDHIDQHGGIDEEHLNKLTQRLAEQAQRNAQARVPADAKLTPIVNTVATMAWSDGEHHIKVHDHNGVETLTVSDKAGATLYDGPMPTDDADPAIPDEVREKVNKFLANRTKLRVITTTPHKVAPITEAEPVERE